LFNSKKLGGDTIAYTKFHSAWAATDELSGAAWNHIETQWTLAKIDIDAHNHDTRYYTKTLADTTFFSTSYYIGFDADKIDGQHVSDLLASAMPFGAIMIHSGTDANVPAGWHICDGGTYGGKASPDLRDRFVIGAGGAYAVNATAGPATWNGTITPTGSVTIGDHALTTTELPVHTHTFSEEYALKNNYRSTEIAGTSYNTIASATTTIDQQTSGDDAHGHTGSTASIMAIDPRPTWYSLYYIMKYA
jgi:hypothetical protein